MRVWDFQIHKPVRFNIAADSRFSPIDVYNDQIWEFGCATREPLALTLTTTYGLRAQGMRVFPRFTVNQNTYINPLEFYAPPRLLYFLPNYFSLTFSPCEELEINAEYWASTSHNLAGRYAFRNKGNKVLTLRFDLCCDLKPLGEGHNMQPDVLSSNAILLGSTHDLTIVCALSGNAQGQQSPFPTLTQDVQIVPGKSKTIDWALASENDVGQSYGSIKSIFAKTWEAEIARLLMLNESQTVEINTGDGEWDLIFAAAQRTAMQLTLGNIKNRPGFVTSRSVDMGYSFAEEGRGLIPQWKKQTALDAYFLAGYLLPGGKNQVRQILDGFLSKYKDPANRTGEIDQPVLCTIAFDYYQASHDDDWLRENIDALQNFLSQWFVLENDRDQDGFPEWQDIVQSGLEENPTFQRWKPETQGLSVRLVESPALGAFLYREYHSLLQLTTALQNDESRSWFEEKMSTLQQRVDECWHERAACYLYRDFDTHICQKGKLLTQFDGNADQALNKSFSKPQRLLIHVTGKDETRRKFKIVLQGKHQKEQIVEEIDYYNLSWLNGRAYYTSNYVYTRIEHFIIDGMNEDDHIELYCAHHQMMDISLLLPLWAQMAPANKAARLIDKTLARVFWGEFGLPIAPQGHRELFLAKPPKVSGIWNMMIGQGLMNYHKPELACELVQKLMTASSKIFDKQFGFQEAFHVQTAEPSGESGHLRGFPPLSLFLEVLGVKYIHKDRVVISGNNPFPWPVTVKYKGTHITRHQMDTVITFSSGHTITLSEPEPTEIRLVQEDIIE